MLLESEKLGSSQLLIVLKKKLILYNILSILKFFKLDNGDLEMNTVERIYLF